MTKTTEYQPSAMPASGKSQPSTKPAASGSCACVNGAVSQYPFATTAQVHQGVSAENTKLTFKTFQDLAKYANA